MSYGEISLNQETYEAAVKACAEANNGLTVGKTDIPEGSSTSDAMDAFRSRLEELLKVVSDYQGVVLVGLMTLADIEKQIVGMDRTVALEIYGDSPGAGRDGAASVGAPDAQTPGGPSGPQGDGGADGRSLEQWMLEDSGLKTW